MAATVKAPLGVRVKDGVEGSGVSKPLGIWPSDFATRYQGDGYMAKMGGIRKQTLPHLQRYDAQNAELMSARVGGRQPNVPDVHARTRMLAETKKARDAAYANRNALWLQVRDQTESLKPFDAPKTAHEIALQQEYRAMLRAAPNETVRTDLLKSFEYRQAALAPGASATLSGMSPTMFERYQQERLRQRYPNEMQLADDFKTADDIVEHHLRALDAMIETESKSLGIPLIDPKEKPPTPEWE